MIGVNRDHVVLLLGGAQVIATVLDDNVHVRFIEVEVRAGDIDDLRVDLHAIDLHIRAELLCHARRATVPPASPITQTVLIASGR